MPKPQTSLRHVVLDNGLSVILKETHAAPVTSTWLWYRVGSRNEVEGHTGMSHWVEHMMFKGSPRFPKGSIMRMVDRHGGYVNAMTSYDFTAYYMTLPSDRAQLALDIEADRMVDACFDEEELNAERTVIIAEREGSENEPRSVLAEEMTAAAFRVHPYHHQTIGWKEDLRAITGDQLRAHYRQHYMPNNAVLVVVGDFSTEHYLAEIEERFGKIPAGESVPSAIRKEPPQRGERRVTLRMPGSAPIVRIGFHTPPVSHPDFIPLVVLDAVLSGGKAMFSFGGAQARSARLYRALVETQLASTVGSGYHASLDPYLLTLLATVREERAPEDVEQALMAQIALLRDEPATEAELRVAIRQTQAQFAYSSESVTSQALTLGFLDIVDHHERMDSVLDELAAVTPDDVMRVAQTYLREDNSVVGHYIPSEEDSESAAGPASGDEIAPVAYWRRPTEECIGGGPLLGMTRSGGAVSATISPETVVHRVLDNGVTILIKENPASASVTVNASLLGGSVHEEAHQAGLAALTAAMLRRGTDRHTYQELNATLENVGAAASFSSGRDEMGFGGYALAEDMDLLIEHLAEIVLGPTFPAQELDKLRGQYLTHLTMLESDTGYRSDQACLEALYPSSHPYGRPLLGTREILAGFTREDLLSFYGRCYLPGTLAISVVGAIEADRALDRLADTFGRWRVDAPVPQWHLPDAPPLEGIVRETVHLPAKSQVDLTWGVVGMARSSPDYYAAMMANIVMGRLGLAGRLGDSVRDQQGLAYYVNSSLHAGRGAHPWNIVAGVSPKDVDRAVDSILAEVALLCQDGTSDEELDDCRSYLTGALPLRLETNDGISSYLLSIQEHGLGLDYLQRYPGIIGAVTQQQIKETAQRYLTLDRYVLALAGTLD